MIYKTATTDHIFGALGVGSKEVAARLHQELSIDSLEHQDAMMRLALFKAMSNTLLHCPLTQHVQIALKIITTASTKLLTLSSGIQH